MSKDPKARNPYEQLEAATGTLEKERRFFEALLAADPVAEVVNRIIHLVTLFQGAEKFIPPYLEAHATRLFPKDSMKVAAILYRVLLDITRSARLAGYLCLKGIPEQALAVLRGGIEQVGVYTHVWRDPRKYRFVPDADSEQYRQAFRSTDDKAVNRRLKGEGIKFRFMHCKAAKPLSKYYELLSSSVIHGSSAVMGTERVPALSCEFVDRDTPVNLAQLFGAVHSIMAALYLEVLGSIPGEDLLEDELAPLSLTSGLFFPFVGFAPGDEQRELSDKMLGALAASLKIERPVN